MIVFKSNLETIFAEGNGKFGALTNLRFN